jgi:hypothetical protein
LLTTEKLQWSVSLVSVKKRLAQPAPAESDGLALRDECAGL